MKKLPYIHLLYPPNLKRLIEFKLYGCHYPPGHYANPIPTKKEIIIREEMIFAEKEEVTDIELNITDQENFLSELKPYYRLLPFQEKKNSITRYYYLNPLFSYADGVFLSCMLIHLRPKRVIEVGSGFSSALMIDINEKLLNREMMLTFIEPNASRLHSLLFISDKKKYEVQEKHVQDVDIRLFDSLEAGDMLFIDSSHILKTGSDLWYEFFHILPRLKRGVIIHFHDIFYPFEYSKEWVYEGRAYNEIYFLRAFLMYNTTFRIILFPNYLIKKNLRWFETNMPLCLKNPGGSIYLQKNH